MRGSHRVPIAAEDQVALSLSAAALDALIVKIKEVIKDCVIPFGGL